MKYYEVSRDINAPADAVWSVLTQTDKLLEGNLGITRIEGEIGRGEKIKLWTEVSDRPFTLTVTELQPSRRMVWEGGMPLGLFKGIRQFNLTPSGDATRFQMREEFSGLLLPLIWKSMPDLNPAFNKFADGLKLIAESRR